MCSLLSFINVIPGTIFRLYTRSSSSEQRLDNLVARKLRESTFDGKRKTVIVIHGYSGKKRDCRCEERLWFGVWGTLFCCCCWFCPCGHCVYSNSYCLHQPRLLGPYRLQQNSTAHNLSDTGGSRSRTRTWPASIEASQLVGHRTGIAEVMGSNPLESQSFFWALFVTFHLYFTSLYSKLDIPTKPGLYILFSSRTYSIFTSFTLKSMIRYPGWFAFETLFSNEKMSTSSRQTGLTRPAKIT